MALMLCSLRRRWKARGRSWRLGNLTARAVAVFAGSCRQSVDRRDFLGTQTAPRFVHTISYRVSLRALAQAALD